MWQLELWLRNSFSGNIFFSFSVLVLCSVRCKSDWKLDQKRSEKQFYSDSAVLFQNVRRDRHDISWHQPFKELNGSDAMPEIHYKEPIPKILYKYSQKMNCAATVLISTFMCLWAISIFSWSICLFCCRKYVDRSWKYVNRSQTHEWGNWDWSRAIPRKGIQKWDFSCSVQYSTVKIQDWPGK